MSYSILSSRTFDKELKRLAKKYPSLKNDLRFLSEELKTNPFQGIPLGKECYKIRIAIASKGKGKSGGGRIITCVKIISHHVYLLTIYDKSEKENISGKELEAIIQIAGLK